MIDKQKLSKMKVARHLLPPPGPEVVGECIEMIDALTQENKELKRECSLVHNALVDNDEEIKELKTKLQKAEEGS